MFFLENPLNALFLFANILTIKLWISWLQIFQKCPALWRVIFLRSLSCVQESIFPAFLQWVRRSSHFSEQQSASEGGLSTCNRSICSTSFMSFKTFNQTGSTSSSTKSGLKVNRWAIIVNAGMTTFLPVGAYQSPVNCGLVAPTEAWANIVIHKRASEELYVVFPKNKVA